MTNSATTQQVTALIASIAQQYGVDPNLAIEVAIQESGLNQNAVGGKGEIGVFQLLPATAAMLGVDPTDLQQNIQGGCMYLAQLITEFNGNEQAAVAAYNWGPTNVANAMAGHGVAWLNAAPSSTQNYVSAILGNIASEYSVSVGVPGSAAPTSADTVLESGVAPASVSGISLGMMAVVLCVALLMGLALSES